MALVHIVFDVDDSLTSEQLHEALCLTIHEGARLEADVGDLVSNIELVGDAFDGLDEDQKTTVFNHIEDGNDRNDLVTTICEGLSQKEIDEILNHGEEEEV